MRLIASSFGILVGLGATIVAAPGAALGNVAKSSESKVIDVMEALPGDTDGSVRVEAAILVRDLRVYQRWSERQRENAQKTRVGAQYYAPGAQEAAFGFDLLSELVRILDAAAPQGGAVPAGVAGFTSVGGIGAQAFMKVGAGFLERLEAAFASPKPPAWPGKITGGTLEISVKEKKVIGKVMGDWLRLAPTEEMLIGAGEPTAVFEGTMRRRVESADGLLFVRGGGAVSGLLGGLIDDPTAAEMVRNLRAAAITWEYDGDRTAASRILLDLPQLQQLGPVVRKPDVANDLVPLWGPEATAFFSLSLPPMALQAMLPAVEGELQSSGQSLPEAVAAGLTKLDGRIGVVTYGAPRDWALGLRFTDAAAAQAIVPAVQKWVAELAAKENLDLNKTLVLEPFAGSTSDVIHWRPDVGLEGLRVAAIGSTVVFTVQKSRMSALLAPPAGKGPSLLTPMIQKSMGEPSLLLGYMVLGDDGLLFDYLVWLTSSLRDAAQVAMKEVPQLAMATSFLERLPTEMALAGLQWALMYDVAIAADVENSVLVIEMISSEI